jgi:hypothetical protein
VSQVERPNVRWTIDATHVFCGQEGWCRLTAIIDFHERAASIKLRLAELPDRMKKTPDFHSHSRVIRFWGSVHAGIRQGGAADCCSTSVRETAPMGQSIIGAVAGTRV